MKVKMLCRNPDDYIRETKSDIHKLQRNYDPTLHPFEAAREYIRALNAVKLERVFAKPFIQSLDGHRDGIVILGKHPQRLSMLVSGSCDGEVRVWDVPTRACTNTIQAHDGFVRGLTFTPDGENMVTVGGDQTVKKWAVDGRSDDTQEEPLSTTISKTLLTGVSHHYSHAVFATCGEMCQIWEDERAEPLKTFQWGVKSLQCVKFNPIETNLLAACASDRTIILYDIRETEPLRKVTLRMRSNTICWNPMEAFHFTVANEDYNLYSFDMRQLKRPYNTHLDHVSAVLDVDYSPTGREFVSGSYDKTIRIFRTEERHSRDVYHTKRMQRLSCVLWSMDNNYVFSGSDEMNIRLWKAKSSQKLGVMSQRETAAVNYNEKLKEKYVSHPKVKRISRYRHVPKHVHNARRELEMMRNSRDKKEANRRASAKPGTLPKIPDSKKIVLAEDE